MKRIYIIVGLAFLLINVGYSQNNKEKKKPAAAEYLGVNYAAQYNLAIQVKDYESACSALYGLLAINENDTNSLNCLLTIYFQRGQTEQCFLLCQQFLPKFRENTTLLDFRGKSAELLGRYTDALECYQKLYIITKQIYYGFQVANVENTLGRKIECLQHVEDLLKDPYIATKHVTLYSDSVTTAGKGENVTLKAALYNLKGNSLSDLGKYGAARESFLEALNLEPDFEIARTGFNRIKSK